MFPVLSQVQPHVGDVDYGTTRKQRGKLLYSLEYNATASEVIKPAACCLQSSWFNHCYGGPERSKLCNLRKDKQIKHKQPSGNVLLSSVFVYLLKVMQ